MRRILPGGMLLVLAFGFSGMFSEAAIDPEKQVLVSIEEYMAAWNETDKSIRTALLKSCWADKISYFDPGGPQADTLAGLDKIIVDFLTNEQLKRMSVVAATGVDLHHHMFRVGWKVTNQDGNILATGIDYGEFNEEGRLTKVVGFFDPLPELK
jgi:hypothetical protein